jgi:hypothetical protein
MPDIDVDQIIDMLGYTYKDKITGLTGPVVSVCFDLYGCVQATIHRGIGKNGEALESYWYDVQRLEKQTKPRLMEKPYYNKITPETYDRGPADKPRNRRA